MAESFGQLKAVGHSHGSVGHGGMHRVGGHGTAVGHMHSNPHTQSNMAGHTMKHEHGGNFGMGC